MKISNHVILFIYKKQTINSHKIVVTPLLMHWSYRSLTPSHRNNRPGEITVIRVVHAVSRKNTSQKIAYETFVPLFHILNNIQENTSKFHQIVMAHVFDDHLFDNTNAFLFLSWNYDTIFSAFLCWFFFTQKHICIIYHFRTLKWP